MTRVTLLYMSLMSDICFFIQFVVTFWFGGVNEENLASHKNVAGQRRKSLIAFADSCGYSFGYYTRT